MKSGKDDEGAMTWLWKRHKLLACIVAYWGIVIAIAIATYVGSLPEGGSRDGFFLWGYLGGFYFAPYFIACFVILRVAKWKKKTKGS